MLKKNNIKDVNLDSTTLYNYYSKQINKDFKYNELLNENVILENLPPTTIAPTTTMSLDQLLSIVPSRSQVERSLQSQERRAQRTLERIQTPSFNFRNPFGSSFGFGSMRSRQPSTEATTTEAPSTAAPTESLCYKWNGDGKYYYCSVDRSILPGNNCIKDGVRGEWVPCTPTTSASNRMGGRD